MSKLMIAIGSDHAGFELKEKLRKKLEELGYETYDMGAFDTKSVDYPIIAYDVAKEVTAGNYDRGILVCGSGIGMAIAANRIPSVRAAVCNDLYSAKMSRSHNDANVLAMGSRIVGEELAYEIARTWLETDFEAGRHQRRVDMLG